MGTRKNLSYWKKKLIDTLKADVTAKSLSDFGIMEKGRGLPVGTIREWNGKKFKKLSSGKWMRTYTGTGERGERQASRNVMNKIQKAESMEDLLQIVRDNRERFKDEDGRAIPIVKEFLDAARAMSPKERKESPKPDQEKPKEKKSLSTKELNFIADWAQGDIVENVRNSFRLKDGTTNEKSLGNKGTEDAKKYDKSIKMIEDNLKPVEEDVLYRGTNNNDWLKVSKGDKIPTGMASFSKSQRVAQSFTGKNRVILRYTKPPQASGLDVSSIKENNTDKKWWSKRGADMTQYQYEEEVALRSKDLVVKDVKKEKFMTGRGIEVEYTVVDVGVGNRMSKAISGRIRNELSDDFNNALSERKKKQKIVVRRK